MADAATIFGLAALGIFIGFLSTLLFEKTRVPDVLILITLGLVVGPFLGLILFDGGLDLRYNEVVRKFGSVTFLMGVTLVIVLTNEIVTAGVFIVERKRLKARQIPPAELELPY